MQRPLASLLERMSQWGEVRLESGIAVFSECGKYRYLLERQWSTAESRVLTFVMLNPSTATAKEDDPTIRSCKRLAMEANCGGLRVMNLFAFRTPSPEKLLKAKEPVGLLNDHYLQQLSAREMVVVAWGAGSKFANRAHQVWKSMSNAGVGMFCYGQNSDGSPKHPLYLPTAAKMQVFKEPRGW